jgi:hypothetical protein
MNQNSNLKKYARISLVILALSLVPIFWISFYDHPFGDDYNYGNAAHLAWMESHDLIRLLQAAVKTSADTYQTWQGSYTGCFMMALQAGIFGEKYYFLSVWLVLAAFLGGLAYFLKTILMKCLHTGKYEFQIVYSLVAILCLNLLPSPAEGIFWYNGAFYYTGYFGLVLLLAGLCIRVFNQTMKVKPWKIVLISLLALFIGGGNMSTNLIMLLSLLYLYLFALARKEGRSYLPLLPVLVCAIAGFLLNLTAPGNAIRENGYVNGYGFLETILLSFQRGCTKIEEYSSVIALIIYFVFFVPILWSYLKKTEFRFPYPILATVLLYAVMACQNAPMLYATGNDASYYPRILNLVYFSYLLVTFLVVLYWEGYLAHRIDLPKVNISQSVRKELAVFSVLFLMVGAIGTDRVTTFTSISSMLSIVRGQAQTYSEARFEREKQYLNAEADHAETLVLEPLPAIPGVFLQNADISDDPAYWLNAGVSSYYHIGSVKLAETEQ